MSATQSGMQRPPGGEDDGPNQTDLNLARCNRSIIFMCFISNRVLADSHRLLLNPNSAAIPTSSATSYSARRVASVKSMAPRAGTVTQDAWYHQAMKARRWH